jgi:hypothetical protein
VVVVLPQLGVVGGHSLHDEIPDRRHPHPPTRPTVAVGQSLVLRELTTPGRLKHPTREFSAVEVSLVLVADHAVDQEVVEVHQMESAQQLTKPPSEDDLAGTAEPFHADQCRPL